MPGSSGVTCSGVCDDATSARMRTPGGRGPRALAWHGPEDPGDWQAVPRTFREGHTETWYAADARLGWWGPDGFTCLVVATADPATLPDKATWYLAANLPRPGGPREADSVHPAASLAEVVRSYGIPHWTEQSGSVKHQAEPRPRCRGLTARTRPKARP
jgi:hypothetical protein